MNEKGRTKWRANTCKVCGIPFRSSRMDAELCSWKCRKFWSRHGRPYPALVAARVAIAEKVYNPATRTIPGLEEAFKNETPEKQSQQKLAGTDQAVNSVHRSTSVSEVTDPVGPSISVTRPDKSRKPAGRPAGKRKSRKKRSTEKGSPIKSQKTKARGKVSVTRKTNSKKPNSRKKV